jgi:transcriptional regulator with XRE-family HTH domain
MSESETLSPSSLVSDNLRTLRYTARLSQSEVLKRLEGLGAPMDQAALSRKESGHRAITVEDLYRFAAILNVTPADLLMPQQPRGEVALAPDRVEKNARIRSWIRGRRPLGLYPGLYEAGYRLRDLELEQQAKSVVQRLLQAMADVKARTDRLAYAQEHLKDLKAQPSLFDEDPARRDPIEVAEDRVRAEKRDLEEATDRERELREEMNELKTLNADEGWIEPDEFDELLNERRIPGVA